jgi:flagellar hook-length control protein FliK
MTISTYTELIPVVADESLQPVDNLDKVSTDRISDEINETSGFAQLLARLLQNTEKLQTDIPLIEFSEPDVNFEIISVKEELIDRQEKLNFFEDIQQSANLTENEISEDEIPEEHFDALASVENLLSSVKSDPEQFQYETIDTETAETINNLQRAELPVKTSFEDELSNGFLEKDFSVLFADNAGKTPELFLGAEHQSISVIPEKTVKDLSTEKRETADIKPSDSFSLKKPENENRGKLDETRNRSRRDKITFDIRDQRTEIETSATKPQRLFSVVEATAKRASGETPVREITLELRLPEGHNSSVNVQGQTIWETKSGNNGSVNTTMENLLARELHQNFNGDIVRHASMALRDGGEGTIKLTLKPENLGNVKIHFEMTENKITGHIVVESKEAMNAFRKELNSLEQAFRDSGFANAELSLSLSSGGQNNRKWEQDSSPFTHQIAASRYDDSSIALENHDTLIADFLIGRTSGSVNMLA